jgi:hypothetical protein
VTKEQAEIFKAFGIPSPDSEMKIPQKRGRKPKQKNTEQK